MRLAILKADAVRPEWVPRFGEYPDMFIALLSQLDAELTFDVYDVQQGQYPSAVQDADAYLVTGSKSSVYDAEPWIADLQDFVLELHIQRKKLVGICFGHQLVAQALGGRVERSAKGWGVGLHTHHFVRLPYWHDGVPGGLRILVSHQDQVVRAADGASVLAGSEFCETAVCQVDDHILTFQGHPEFTPEYAREIMVFRRDRIGDAAYRAGLASLRGTHQGQRVAAWIINFLRQAPCRRK
ncbi:MAG: GMP synthase [Halioglobus sp.]|nr:GMP synthase [Halioglobus sp.]